MKRLALGWLALTVGCAGAPVDVDDWFERHAFVHRAVDSLLEQDRPAQAIAALQQTLDDRAPLGVDIEAVAMVRKDVLFRLADIHLSQKDYAAALAATDRGLSLGASADVFTVNLYIVRGRVLEALERTKEAAAVYHEALVMTGGMLDAMLSDP